MSIVDCRSGAASGPRRRRGFTDTQHSTLDLRPPAFTLIELLVVIGIIGLVVALGVPLFGVLTGSRSQEAGQNIVAAAIGQARTIAVNEGKYAGVLFYVDPATERTAMSLIIVADPQSGLEDPDPYDKYKTFVPNQIYKSPLIAGNNTVIAGDRVIGLVSDASATFKTAANLTPTQDVYNTASPAYSRLSLYLPNYKPTVRVYRGRMDPISAATGTFSPIPDAINQRPARSGPYYSTAYPAGTGGTTPATQYRRIQPASSAIPTSVAVEADVAPFTNPNWGPDVAQEITPYATGGEQQLLPIGVGVQLIIQPTARADDTNNPPAFVERYVRTGVIMFDPQGRLTLPPRSLDKNSTIGKYLGLSADIIELPAAVGVVLYDRVAFKSDPTRTDADWLSQNVPASANTRINSSLATLSDNATTTQANEATEETWLDSNTTPLLINRFSGALSEGQ